MESPRVDFTSGFIPNNRLKLTVLTYCQYVYLVDFFGELPFLLAKTTEFLDDPLVCNRLFEAF